MGVITLLYKTKHNETPFPCFPNAVQSPFTTRSHGSTQQISYRKLFLRNLLRTSQRERYHETHGVFTRSTGLALRKRNFCSFSRISYRLPDVASKNKVRHQNVASEHQFSDWRCLFEHVVNRLDTKFIDYSLHFIYSNAAVRTSSGRSTRCDGRSQYKDDIRNYIATAKYWTNEF